MRVAIDSTPLTVSSGGIPRYTSALFKALTSHFPEDEFLYLTDQGNPALSKLERRWWAYGLPKQLRKLKIDVFHGADFAVPYFPVCPAVMTVHDLSPWMNPAWHDGAGRIRRRTPILLKLGLATMVITDCEAVRREVIERFRLPAERVVAIPLAADENFRPVDSPSSDPYFLFVGTLEPRKNIPFLIEAWRRLYQEIPVKLVLAGRRRTDCPPIESHPGLEIMGEVPEAALPGLYSGALAVVYPSLYEGFGLPVLEAMACGAPVITSRDPALMELAGGAAVHCDVTESGQWVEAMRTMLLDNNRGQQLQQAGIHRAREFSWRRTAILTHEVYAEAAARFRRRSG